MKINEHYINDYKNIIQTTNLQQGYQEFIKFFRYLRIYLEKELQDYIFTGNIVENNMDYSYFQFTDKELKTKGLKIVIVFVHKEFNYQVWLSGVNRRIQAEYYNKLKGFNNKYILTTNPEKLDYIFKNELISECCYDNLDKLMNEIKYKVTDFIADIKQT